MAVPNLGEISAITQKHFIRKLVDNIFDSNATLQRWRQKGIYQSYPGGTNIVFPVLYATTTASGWYQGTDTLNTTANDQIDAGQLEMKQHFSNITITAQDELNNSGPEQMIDFVASKVQASEKTLADNLGTGIYNDGTTDTKALTGLRHAVSSGRTYAGINSSTQTWWDAQVDSTSTTLTLKVMGDQFQAAAIDNDKPSLITTTAALIESYINLLQPQQRFADADTANAGFQNVLFRGTPVVEDSHVPSSHMFMLNESYIMLKYHADRNFKFEPFIKPTNQDVSTAKIFWAGEMCVNNPRMSAKFTALTA